MTEFSASSVLEVSVDQRSLRDARSEIEDELGGVEVSASGQLASSAGGGAVEQSNTYLNTATDQLKDNLKLNDTRNDLLRELLDIQEATAGGGDGGGRIPRPRGLSGGLAGGATLAVGAVAASLASVNWANTIGDAIPDIDPGDVVDDVALEVSDVVNDVALEATDVVTGVALEAADIVSGVSLSPSDIVSPVALTAADVVDPPQRSPGSGSGAGSGSGSGSGGLLDIIAAGGVGLTAGGLSNSGIFSGLLGGGSGGGATAAAGSPSLLLPFLFAQEAASQGDTPGNLVTESPGTPDPRPAGPIVDFLTAPGQLFDLGQRDDGRTDRYGFPTETAGGGSNTQVTVNNTTEVRSDGRDEREIEDIVERKLEQAGRDIGNLLGGLP